MATGSRSLEREAKLGTDLAFRLPDLDKVVGRAVPRSSQELRAAYFDTDDLRLWNRGITLRHRSGEDGDDGRGMWTVKLPSQASGATLDRTELTWPADRATVPTDASALLRGIIRWAPLEQVTELVTWRQRLVLHDARGRACGELDDDTVTVVGGRHDGLRFRQLEIELAPGGDAILRRVVKRLRRAGARVGDEPKLAKALGPQGDGPVAKALDPHVRVAAVVRSSIASALERLLDHDYRLRLDQASPPPYSVHQARVATRRLRSDLKTLRDVLDPQWVETTRTELRWFGGVLGAVRDADVRGDHLGHDDDDGNGVSAGAAGRAALRRSNDQQRRVAVGALSEAITGERYLSLLDRLHAAAASPPFMAAGSEGRAKADQRASAVLPALVGHQWRTLRRRVGKAGSHPSDAELHRIRIGAKQLRYAAELATPVMGAVARRTAKAAEDLQTVLGEHHDAVTAEQWLRHEALDAIPAASFSAGLLVAEQSRRQRRLRRRWRRVWDELNDKKRRRWMR
jgi:CHAD domain-containing protein